MNPDGKRKMPRYIERMIRGLLFMTLMVGLVACGGKPDHGREAQSMPVEGREMLQAFTEDEYAAEEKYLQERLLVRGIVTSISNDLFGRPIVVLDGTTTQGVMCHFTSDPHGAKGLRVGVRAGLEGWAESYDGTVNLERCRVVEIQ